MRWVPAPSCSPAACRMAPAPYQPHKLPLHLPSTLQCKPVRIHVRCGRRLPARLAGHGLPPGVADRKAGCWWDSILEHRSLPLGPSPSHTFLSPLPPLQCCSARRRCCASLEACLAVLLVAWWAGAATTATVYGTSADSASPPLHRSAARTSVWAMGWAQCGLWALSVAVACACRRAARHRALADELSGKGRSWAPGVGGGAPNEACQVYKLLQWRSFEAASSGSLLPLLQCH